MNLRCCSEAHEKIILAFWPCNQDRDHDISWEAWHQCEDPLRVYETDYSKLLLDHLCLVFPLENPITGEEQESFDICWDNWICREAWLEIIDSIRSNPASNEAEQHFYDLFLKWIEEQLEHYTMIVVEGNL